MLNRELFLNLFRLKALFMLILLGFVGVGLSIFSISWAQDPPIEFRLEPNKQIFSHSEGLVMILSWLAKKPVKLCLAKDLLSQTQVEVSRSGRGKLPLEPLVIEDKSKLLD